MTLQYAVPLNPYFFVACHCSILLTLSGQQMTRQANLTFLLSLDMPCGSPQSFVEVISFRGRKDFRPRPQQDKSRKSRPFTPISPSSLFHQLSRLHFPIPQNFSALFYALFQDGICRLPSCFRSPQGHQTG